MHLVQQNKLKIVPKFKFMSRRSFDFLHPFAYRINQVFMKYLHTGCYVNIKNVMELTMLCFSNTFSNLVKIQNNNPKSYVI